MALSWRRRSCLFLVVLTLVLYLLSSIHMGHKHVLNILEDKKPRLPLPDAIIKEEKNSNRAGTYSDNTENESTTKKHAQDIASKGDFLETWEVSERPDKSSLPRSHAIIIKEENDANRAGDYSDEKENDSTTKKQAQDIASKVTASRKKRPENFVYVKEDPFNFANKDDFFLTEGLHVSPPPPIGSCSCWNTSEACCERGIHANHKMGHNLVDTLFRFSWSPYHRAGFNVGTAHFQGRKLGFRSPPEYFNRRIDYREVFVVRNFVSALVSGYLYHKVGHECWIDGYGRQRSARDWGYRVTKRMVRLPAPWPEPNNRSICRYLAETDEEAGMRVYAEFVMRKYYAPTLGIFKAVQENEDPFHRRTLFVCFEDLYYPEKKDLTIQRIMDWLYPGGQNHDLPPAGFEENEDCGSDHDPATRERLSGIVKRLDAEVFNGVFGKAQEFFGRCGEDERPGNTGKSKDGHGNERSGSDSSTSFKQSDALDGLSAGKSNVLEGDSSSDLTHGVEAVTTSQERGGAFAGITNSSHTGKGNLDDLLARVAASRSRRPAKFTYLSEDPFDFAKDDKFVVTEGLHVSSPPPTGPCSCWNTSQDCCERSIRVTHKMGHNLVTQLFRLKWGPFHRDGYNPHRPGLKYSSGKSGFISPPGYFDRGIDYREVFVTRNWFSTMVSGYLYHKEGHGCWIDGYGRPYKKGFFSGFSKRYIRLPDSSPPPNGRSLCQYFVEEDEEVGMRVWMEHSTRLYYQSYLAIFKAVQENEDPLHRRTLFVCYEDLYNPVTKYATIQRMMDFLYPGGQEHDVTVSAPPPADSSEGYSGCHASDHDPNQRERLHRIARKLDSEVFHGAFSKAQEYFGCGERRS